ncbi:MAG: hypothetical protein ABIQ51_00585, partial [Mesorhizobium sp.]
MPRGHESVRLGEFSQDRFDFLSRLFGAFELTYQLMPQKPEPGSAYIEPLRAIFGFNVGIIIGQLVLGERYLSGAPWLESVAAERIESCSTGTGKYAAVRYYHLFGS